MQYSFRVPTGIIGDLKRDLAALFRSSTAPPANDSTRPPKYPSIPFTNAKFRSQKEIPRPLPNHFAGMQTSFFWPQFPIPARKTKILQKTGLRWEIWVIFLPAQISLSLLITDYYIRKKANPFSFRDICKGGGFFQKARNRFKMLSDHELQLKFDPFHIRAAQVFLSSVCLGDQAILSATRGRLCRFGLDRAA
jgi:hypothetical protein